MIALNLDIDIKKMQSVFASISTAAKSMQPVMERASGVLLASAQQNFAQESARQPHQAHVAPSNFWADLKESTKQRRTAQGTWPGKKLQNTGRLLASLERTHTQTSAEVGTNVPYGKYLQYGTKKMVARPFLALQKEDADIIMQTVKEHFEKNLKN